MVMLVEVVLEYHNQLQQTFIPLPHINNNVELCVFFNLDSKTEIHKPVYRQLAVAVSTYSEHSLLT